MLDNSVLATSDLPDNAHDFQVSSSLQKNFAKDKSCHAAALLLLFLAEILADKIEIVFTRAIPENGSATSLDA
jgi:hypothetical protein